MQPYDDHHHHQHVFSRVLLLMIDGSHMQSTNSILIPKTLYIMQVYSFQLINHIVICMMLTLSLFNPIKTAAEFFPPITSDVALSVLECDEPKISIRSFDALFGYRIFRTRILKNYSWIQFLDSEQLEVSNKVGRR